ncbi:helix-turn-helix domain-containing protein [Geothrix sp. PMB-07]|uniref:helix-turn-helix domain-containing protein n=1 Tax=Geothrix sp. PMB-07 TaxID=3068640 RepID=UPI002741AEBE|nr:helix-turn-helix domain-containing protein [Geothrix sp. PMB-07]WLT30872.1 helix-turn-helix domain-containing protein [Geothrix sp. PMB-07]
MNHTAPRMFLVAVHGAITLGKPLPLRTTAFGTQVIPLAEVLPETYEAPLRFYSIKSLALMSDVSVSTIKREIDDKRLKAQKRGRRVVISHEAAMAYLASLPPAGSQLTLDDLADGVDRVEGK